MKKLIYSIPCFMLLILGACGSSQVASSTASSDTSALNLNTADTNLTGKLFIPQNVALGKPVEMTFTVYNNLGYDKTFCKWHTPFEPFMSKYLDIYLNGTEEVQYLGAMAKRVMPPPANSYLNVKSKDSLSTKVNLSEGYAITKPGDYTVKYNSQSISGIKMMDSLKFTVK